MKTGRNKKLNRKGFTLIELLAVIVILAVIMVIATTSVLSATNESKKKSLVDSANSARNAFDTAYAEMTLTNETKLLDIDAYGDNGLLMGNAKDLSPAFKKLKITDKDYDTTSAKSFVYYNTTDSTFLVCVVAKETGNFYYGPAAKNARNAANEQNKTADGKSYVAGTMWACSDGTNSWS